MIYENDFGVFPMFEATRPFFVGLCLIAKKIIVSNIC